MEGKRANMKKTKSSKKFVQKFAMSMTHSCGSGGDRCIGKEVANQ